MIGGTPMDLFGLIALMAFVLTSMYVVSLLMRLVRSVEAIEQRLASHLAGCEQDARASEA